MLSLILGRKRTGKTALCVKAAKEAAELGKEVILLVPEQFSFECQRLLLETLGPVVSNKIKIHSFTSLCSEICTCYGGIAGRNVDDGIRFLLTRLAIISSADSMKHYSKYVYSADFAKKAVSAVTEMKQSCVSKDDLSVLSKTVQNTAFSDKLHDIALILGAYDALTKHSFTDPLDLVEKTVSLMRGSDFFSGKTVIIDEFKGFTASQYLMLDRIIAGSEQVVAAFCCDSAAPRSNVDIFANVSGTAAKLIRYAASHGIGVETNVLPEPADRQHVFESFLSGRSTGTCRGDDGTVTIISAGSVHDEIGLVMNEIRRLVRENGYRYRDIVIISRTGDRYLNAVRNIAAINDVPCFTDTRIPASELPLSVFVTSALSSVKLDTKEILKYLKTGLAGLSDGEISTLENYVYVWSISGKKWLSDWDMNPAGLKSGEAGFDNTKLNELREKAIAPIVRLARIDNATAEEFSAAVMRLIDDCNTIGTLKEYADALDKKGMLREAEYQRAGYDVFIKVLDKICAVSKGTLTHSEFSDMLSQTLSFETVGEIPQTKDEVMFGTADRIRPLRPKVVFLVGVNEDVFPASLKNDGLFSSAERTVMIDNGFCVADNALSDRIDENFLFYYSAAAASDKVYLSYSETGANGAALEPSSELVRIKKSFEGCGLIAADADPFSGIVMPESKHRAFEAMAGNYLSGSDAVEALKRLFSKDALYSARLGSVDDAAKGNAPVLSGEAAKKLYGNDIQLSASKIEDFGECRFSYFCKYGLGARRLDKVDFDPLTRGNIVHYALEQFVNAHIDDIGTIDPAAIPDEVSKICDGYLLYIGAGKESLDDRFFYMINAIKRTVTYVCTALNNEFAQSKFRPRFCELKVGKGEAVEPVTVKSDNGCNVHIKGSIDRVDTSPDGSVRVVDYKTGHKSFDLSDLLDGMNMQMLIYLYTIIKNGRELLGADRPAGVLYMRAARNTDTGDKRYIKMDGILDDDREVVRSMEADLGGKIVPAKINKNGTFDAYSKVISTDDFNTIFKYIDMTLARLGSLISNGDISAVPLKNGGRTECEYCDYASVCRKDDQNICREHKDLKICETVETMKEELKEI